MAFNLLLFLYLLALFPKILFRKKKYPSLLQRLGASIPDPRSRPVIWIHGVSVGEIKAAQPLFRALKEENPKAFFLITTTTATGQAEAQRSLPEADAFRYLPLDFTWIVRRWAAALRPKLFLLIESDFWPNLLAAIQKAGGKTILISGKLSRRSAHRFRRFAVFSRRLFDRFDLLLVQNQTHFDRFLPLADPSRLFIAGNLKLDLSPHVPDTPFWQSKISLPIVTVASTHPPEEELILDALQDLPIFLFLAPRHPERFQTVASLLRRKGIPFSSWSSPHLCGEKVLLVDAMGQLPLCYSLSRLAIIGGSFIPRIGGHNILEPCLYRTPVLFGPHMFSQEELASRVLEAKAGLQVPIHQLRAAVCDILEHLAPSMRAAASSLVVSGRGATERILVHLRRMSTGSERKILGTNDLS